MNEFSYHKMLNLVYLISMALCDDELLHTINKIRKLVKKDTSTDNNLTLLLLAAEYGHLDIVRYIVDKDLRL